MNKRLFVAIDPPEAVRTQVARDLLRPSRCPLDGA